jgi:hypothetical protein
MLSQLDCVKDGCFIVVQLPDVMPGVRAAHYVELVGEALHPDCF